MYFGDHSPPHFHAQYGDDSVSICIDSGATLNGHLPRRAARLVEEWRVQHADELRTAWDNTQENELPDKIDPLM